MPRALGAPVDAVAAAWNNKRQERNPMSLSNKVIALLLTIFGGYIVFSFALQQFVIYPRFVELEREEAAKNVDRTLQALQRELDLLLPSAADWGTWDDTYQFVQDANPAYVEANLNGAALEGLAVNALGIYDAHGRLVWGMAYDLEAETPMEMPRLLAPQLPRDHVLLSPMVAMGDLAGIVQGVHGPLLVVARPVLTSAAEGPPMGVVVMARLLDETAVARLAAQARVDVRISAPPEDGARLSAETAPGKIAHSAVALTETGAELVGETTVADLSGTPVLRLSVTTPKDITARGGEALRLANTALAIASGLVLLVLLFGMRRTLLDPISELTAQAVLVGSRQDLSIRLNTKRRDELGLLAREFDRMVERLAEARQQLIEQSYRSGVAEMASGVLHNIGNALTPLGVKIGNLKAALAEAPLEEVGLAAAELAEPGTDGERRVDVEHFMALAGQELSDLVRRTGRDLDGIQTHVDHIQQILADQHRFSRAERVIEPVALAPLVNQALTLLPDALVKGVRVELTAELHRVGAVSTSRVALQQVIGNLLINAAEAIAACGERATPGRIAVTADETLIEAQPMVHLRFSDNGIGIAAEDLARIFSRGFSTKSRGSGMGLHWSANTIQILGGRLFAESDGPGRGACLNLLLPQAVASNQVFQEAA